VQFGRNNHHIEACQLSENVCTRFSLASVNVVTVVFKTCVSSLINPAFLLAQNSFKGSVVQSSVKFVWSAIGLRYSTQLLLKKSMPVEAPSDLMKFVRESIEHPEAEAELSSSDIIRTRFEMSIEFANRGLPWAAQELKNVFMFEISVAE
jgi:hypothetical protein